MSMWHLCNYACIYISRWLGEIMSKNHEPFANHLMPSINASVEFRIRMQYQQGCKRFTSNNLWRKRTRDGYLDSHPVTTWRKVGTQFGSTLGLVKSMWRQEAMAPKYAVLSGLKYWGLVLSKTTINGEIAPHIDCLWMESLRDTHHKGFVWMRHVETWRPTDGFVLSALKTWAKGKKKRTYTQVQ